MAQLDQRARQIVDPMQRQARHHEVKTFTRERQELLVRGHRHPAVQRGHRRREIAANHIDAARAQQRRHHTPTAHIQRAVEAARHVIQPIEQAIRAIAQHIRDAANVWCGPVAMPAHRATVEYLHARVHHTHVRPRPGVAKHWPACLRSPRIVPSGRRARSSRMKRITANTLHSWLLDGHELALLDAREDGEFGTSHLFWAVPCPLSRREIRARALLPRLAVRICCVDDGRGLAEQLATWLEGIGCTDVAVLDGGTKAWADAGYELFSGINVPSKAFGEWVEHHYGTESVDATELQSWIASGRNIAVLDSRTHEEFVRMSIPTGISVPGGELVYRIGDLVPDPKTLVVVNCAGRTRSIMGAESLRRAGIPNKVVALRNGTMGWELAGLRCDRGRTDRFSPGTPKTLAIARERAQDFAESSGVGVVGAIDLARFMDDPDRTLYVLDVRDPAEYRAGHWPGSISAPGGQLVQATDQWVGVRNARIALLDDTGVRARMAGAWLRQMGHRDVFVVEGGLEALRTTARERLKVPELGAPVSTIDVTGLVALLDSGDGTVVIDLARSIDFREGHIPGALWGVRTRLAVLAPQLAGAKHVVIASPDGVVARLAVDEAKGLGDGDVRVLEGGTDAWRAFGRPMVKDRTSPPDDACINSYLRAYDRNSGVEEAMQAYLTWEIELANQIRRDDTVAFGVGEAYPTH